MLLNDSRPVTPKIEFCLPKQNQVQYLGRQQNHGLLEQRSRTINV